MAGYITLALFALVMLSRLMARKRRRKDAFVGSIFTWGCTKAMRAIRACNCPQAAAVIYERERSALRSMKAGVPRSKYRLAMQELSAAYRNHCATLSFSQTPSR